jgi:hypothetical protein
MRNALACVALFCMVESSISAQSSGATSFSGLPGTMKVGRTISITDSAGRQTAGKLTEVSGTSLELLVGDTRERFDADRVQTITARQRNTGRGAKWGFLVGAAFAAVSVVRSSSPDCSVVDCKGMDSPLFIIPLVGFIGGLGAGVGAAIGAASTRERVIYRAQPRPVGVVPLMTKDRLGVGVSISF